MFYFTIITNSDVVIESEPTTEAIYQTISLIFDEIKQKRTRGLYGKFHNSNYLYDVYDDYYFILICSEMVPLRIGFSALERIRKDFLLRFVIQREKLHKGRYRT